MKKHQSYFDQFGLLFQNKIKDLIISNQMRSPKVDYDFIEEILFHTRYARQLALRFQERPDIYKHVLLIIS